MREGKKEGEGDCLLQSPSSDFPIVFRVVTFISNVSMVADRSVGRSGKIWSVEERMERLTGEFGGETCQ